ncbi:hypothetical protein ACH3XW_21910 [Acanthocheilonema viteae]
MPAMIAEEMYDQSKDITSRLVLIIFNSFNVTKDNIGNVHLNNERVRIIVFCATFHYCEKPYQCSCMKELEKKGLSWSV